MDRHPTQLPETPPTPDCAERDPDARPAVHAAYRYIAGLSQDLALRVLHAHDDGLAAIVPGLDMHFAILEWGAQTRRWSSILRLQGPHAQRHVAIAIVPRDEMRAAGTAHAGHADAVVWHDDAFGMERALSRLLPAPSRAATGEQS